MNSRKIAIVSALVLTLGLALVMFGGQRTQAAGPWYVNSTTGNDSFDCLSPITACKTITAAIGKASAGDTINVAAGTYNESVAITKANLTLLGAQAGVDARTRVGAESIINNACSPVSIYADNATLNGFTVQGSTMSDPCNISGIWTNPGGTGTQGGHQILYNIIQNNIAGVELDNTGALQTKMQYNLIQNNNNPGPGSGNAIEVNFGLNNALIDNNKFSGHVNSSLLVVASSSTLTISNNELVAGTPEGIALINVSSSSITGNTSVGSTSFATIDLFGGNNGITISCNLLAGGQRAIDVENPYAVYGVTPNTNITANLNNIQGNAVAGLAVDAGSYMPGILNAENNWWGSPTGPTSPNNPSGTGDAVVDPDNAVDFVPFLTTVSTCTTDACPGDPNKVAPGTCGCGHPDSPGCTTTKKDCHQYVEQQEKNFNDGQKDAKKNFDDQQKADKKTFDSTPHTPAQKKAFEDQQKTDKKNFDDQQKAAKDAFQVQYKANEQQCNQLPK